MKRIRVGIWGLSGVAQRVIIPLLQGGEMLVPPDTGTQWEHRQKALLDYQPPAIAALVSVGDNDENRCARITQISRSLSPFTDWRDMLREGELDALLLTKRPREPLNDILAEMATRGVRYLWINFPPADNADEVLALAAQANLHKVRIWQAQPIVWMRAHRAAIHTISRSEIAKVEHIHIAAPDSFAFPAPDDLRWQKTIRAINLALKIAGTREISGMTRILQIIAGKCGDSISAWARCTNDVTLHILFGATYPTAPRVEIQLNRGDSLICEGGKRLTHHGSQDAVTVYDSNGWNTSDGGTLHGAYAEDLKRFIASCGELNPSSAAYAQFEFVAPIWRSAAYAVQAIHGINRSLRSRALETLPPLRFEDVPPPSSSSSPSSTDEPPPTLPLG